VPGAAAKAEWIHDSSGWWLTFYWYRYDPALDGWVKENQSYLGHPIEDGKIHIVSYDRYIQPGGHGTPVLYHYYWYAAYSITNDEFRTFGLENVEDIDRIDPDRRKAHTDEPINVISGSMVRNETDVIVPCPGLDLEFRRSYNSGLGSVDGPLGPGWTHMYDWHLTETARVFEAEELSLTNLCIQVRNGEGRTFTLTKAGTNGYWRSCRENSWLMLRTTNDECRLRIPGGMEHLFDTNGVLTEISDSWLNTVIFAYTNSYPTNLLTSVEHSNGQRLNLSYQGNKLVHVGTPSTNLSISYSYNDRGELTNVVRSIPSGDTCLRYAYDSSSGCLDHSLTQRVNSAGHASSYFYATNTYDETRCRCTGMVLQSNYYEHLVLYSASNNYSVVTYRMGNTNQVYKYYYDPEDLRVEKIYGPGSTNFVTTYSYDNVCLNVTNKITEEISLGESIRTERTYDERHNVISEAFGYGCTPTNSWTYTWHEDYQKPISVTDPEGHRIEFEYTNAAVSKTKVYYSASNSYDTVYSYTTNGLLSSITNANGHWINYAYDVYGRLSGVVPQTHLLQFAGANARVS